MKQVKIPFIHERQGSLALMSSKRKDNIYIFPSVTSNHILLHTFYEHVSPFHLLLYTYTI